MTLVMILTDLSCDFGGKYEIDVVYAAEEPTCAANAGATRRTATKTVFIVLPLQTDSLPIRRNRFKTSQTNPPWALTGKGERLVIVGEYAGCLVVPIIIHHWLSTHVLNAPGFTTFLRSYSL